LLRALGVPDARARQIAEKPLTDIVIRDKPAQTAD
jgi:hypothetical protein